MAITASVFAAAHDAGNDRRGEGGHGSPASRLDVLIEPEVSQRNYTTLTDATHKSYAHAKFIAC